MGKSKLYHKKHNFTKIIWKQSIVQFVCYLCLVLQWFLVEHHLNILQLFCSTYIHVCLSVLSVLWCSHCCLLVLTVRIMPAMIIICCVCRQCGPGVRKKPWSDWGSSRIYLDSSLQHSPISGLLQKSAQNPRQKQQLK